MFVIPPSCERYMAMQVTQYPDDPMSPERIAIQEAQGYINYLPKVPPERVIDVGCGLGRASVMLHVLYGRPATTQYWMMDSTTPDHGQLMGGWQPEGQEWCNSMSATRTFMAANGIARNRVMCCNLRSRIWPLPPGLTADIVVSTLAVGFHWTIEYWMPWLLPHCDENTLLIFGVRRGKYSADTFRESFAERHLTEIGPREDILVLRGKRC